MFKPLRQDILELARESSQEKFCIVNKIDRISRGKLLPIAAELGKVFQTIFFISSTTGESCEKVLDFIMNYAKEDSQTIVPVFSQSTHEVLVNKIRESLFQYLKEELPYKVEIQIKNIINDKVLEVECNLLTTKSSKPIVISQIKNIGVYARKNIMNFFEKKCNLFLFVKELDFFHFFLINN